MAFNRNRIRVCFVSPWIYPFFNPLIQGSFGGWEVRVSTIVKGLARRGNMDVCVVVGDHGQSHRERREEVQLYSWQRRVFWGISSAVSGRAGGVLWKNILVKYLRQWRGRLLDACLVGGYQIDPAVLTIYDEVNADIYAMAGNSQFSGELAFYCRRRGKKYVFVSGSDIDYCPEYKAEPGKSDMYGVPYALKTYAIENADAHIVQSEKQAQLLRDGYGRGSTVIRNPIDLRLLFPRNPLAQNILWVGKSDDRIKRPSIVLELARQLPEFKFVIILNDCVKDTHAKCLKKASQLPNVKLIEHVPFAQIEGYFADARLHLNTSVFEGFPNTFLQAAKYGVPTISLQVNPGDMLSKYGCGVTCRDDVGMFEKTILEYMRDARRREEAGCKGLKYVREYHDSEKIIPQYEAAFLSVLRAPAGT